MYGGSAGSEVWYTSITIPVHLLWGKRKPTESTEITQTEPTTAISGYVLWYIAVYNE